MGVVFVASDAILMERFWILSSKMSEELGVFANSGRSILEYAPNKGFVEE